MHTEPPTARLQMEDQLRRAGDRVRREKMSARSQGLALQTLATPVIASSLALLSWFAFSNGGLPWLALALLWLVGFFVIGLMYHGVFYLCALPIPDEYQGRPRMLRFVQVFWFLQVPLSMFIGIRPPTSSVATQGLIAVIALAVMLLSNRRNRTISAEPNAAPNRGPRRRWAIREPPGGPPSVS